LDFDLKPAVFGCLTNATAPPLMCWRAVQIFKYFGKSSGLHFKKNFLVGGWGFFVGDVISGGLLGHHGPLHLALSPNR